MMRTSQYLARQDDERSKGLAARPLQGALSSAVKRFFDFAAALLGLIILSPVFAIIAILIRRDSPGPVFYWGPRIGRHGTIFRMLKFRTMYEDTRSYRGPRVTSQDDDRITTVGKWLRDTKLNELPQLWNVLVGEMSLVGPRPEDPTIGKTWPTSIAREILHVRPGITSPASIVYRDEEKMLAATEVMRKYLLDLSPDKMRLDQLYVRYRSFWLDLDVLFWTFLLLLPKIRSYSPPEHNLFVGPVTRLIERYVGWFLGDFMVAFLSIALTGTTLRLFGPLDLGWPGAIEMALGFSTLFSLVGMALNINTINWRKATFWAAGRLLGSWLVVVAAVLALHFRLGLASLRVCGMIATASLLSLVGIVFIRYRERLLSGLLSRLAAGLPNTQATRERVLIVGSGRTAEQIAWLMDHPAYSRTFQIVGFIDDDLRTQGMKIYGSKVIGQIADMQDIVRKHDVGLIILADNQMAARKFREVREIARFSPARVLVAPDIFGSLGGLHSTSRDEAAAGNLDDFQCEHCLARYSANSGRSRRTTSRAESPRRGKRKSRASDSSIRRKRAGRRSETN